MVPPSFPPRPPSRDPPHPSFSFASPAPPPIGERAAPEATASRQLQLTNPPPGVFFLLLLLAGYAGLTSLHVEVYINDKLLHLLTFFLLTVVFYWIVDTNRRRTLHLTLVACTLCLGVGSEFLQGFLPNGRDFDFYDIVANVVGSLAGLGLCSWYHKRMLERKRMQKTYSAVPDADFGDDADIELGEGVVGAQETGVTEAASSGAAAGEGPAGKAMTLEEEVDNWDENAPDDWGGVEDSEPEDTKQRAD